MTDRIEKLLGKGYFPSQLPPPFKTLDLAANHASLYAAWVRLQPAFGKGAKMPKAPSSKSELFSVARTGHQRRVTSLTNPVAQTYLSTHIAQNWASLLAHFRQSRLSASHPRFLRNGTRAANLPSMQMLYERKILSSAGYRHMLRTDISRFFPTIYTHSIPWALHGKAIAKKNRRETQIYFGNLLDLCVRQCQDEQTIGLPIGPDTSHIIAEAIATTVDLELKKRLKYLPAGFRYVDDYFLFFETAAQAETALAALIRSLKDFELQINFEKTDTCSVREISDDFWTHQLRAFQISSNVRKQRSDINHFFELAKELARKNADESVMTYALKRASSVVVRKENWDCFEAQLCHVALANTNVLQSFARVLSTYSGLGFPLDKIRLHRFVNALIQDHAPLGHHSEVAWALWICKDVKLKLNESSIDLVTEMHSSVCALLLLDLHAAGQLAKAPKTSYWKQAESTEALRGDLWLLSYEAGLRGWAGFGDGHIRKDPHFEALRAHQVHFYDQSASLPPIFHVRPEALLQHDVKTPSDLFDLDDFDDLETVVEYDDEEEGYGGVVFPDDEESDPSSPAADNGTHKKSILSDF
jgi:Reverse transcriptase (RNA-dependent DNA polymerase)